MKGARTEGSMDLTNGTMSIKRFDEDDNLLMEITESAINVYKTPVKKPLQKYNIIYGDPPWSFRTYSDKGKQRSADMHYPTMSKKAIQDLPIKNLAAKDCVLLLWVTYPTLEEALELIKKWGFKYQTCGFSWIKENKRADTDFMGMGYWTRSNNEICLLATRGKPKRVSASVRQVIRSKIREHSRKPDEIRQRIVDLLGDLPRIELFARQKHEGWDCWGNEVNSDIIMEKYRDYEAQV